MQRQHLRIFVTTGHNKPFRRLLQAVQANASEHAWDLFVQKGAAGADFTELPGADYITREEFAERLDWADVVIAQGGAGALYEAWCHGHTAIAVPRLSRAGEHVDDHQLYMTRALAQQGKVIVCEEVSELAELIDRVPARQPNRKGETTPLTAAVAREIASGQHNTPRLAPLVRTVKQLLQRASRRPDEAAAGSTGR